MLTASLITATAFPSPIEASQLKNPIAATSIDLNFVRPEPTPDYDLEVLVPLRKAQAEKAEADKRAQLAREVAAVAAKKAAAREATLVQPAQAARSYTVSYGNNYAYGYCTFYVASRTQVPQSMGNANSWGYGLGAAGWKRGGPQPGAVAVSHRGPAGHVAYVEGVVGGMVSVTEMNYFGGGGGWNIVSSRLAPIGEFEYFSK